MAAPISQYALVYDLGKGVNRECVTSTIDQLRRVIDKSITVCRYSIMPEIFERDPKSLKLFVIPGGNYKAMSKEVDFRNTVEKVNCFVYRHGMGYLGICAGAFAAATHQEISDPDFKRENFDPVDLKLTRHDYISNLPSVSLYPGSCCYLTSLRSKIDFAYVRKEGDQGYPLYFNDGCFFPYIEKTATPLLRYSSPLLSYSRDSELGRCVEEPVAALLYPYGEGKIVLSGVHPEIRDRSTIQALTFNNFKCTGSPGDETRQLDLSRRAERTFQGIYGGGQDTDTTMRLFLKALSIPIQKA